jgi:DNA-binding response OmpR family regulator
MGTQRVIVAWDEHVGSARGMAGSFAKEGFAFRIVPSLRGVLSASSGEPPSAILLHAEPGSEAAHAVLGALAKDPKLSRVPVILLCQDSSQRTMITEFRSGLVELLPLPFHPSYPRRVAELLDGLTLRRGSVAGSNMRLMVDHVQRLCRTGRIEVRVGTEAVGSATFSAGELLSCKHRGNEGKSALAALVALSGATWHFVEGPPEDAPAEAAVEVEIIIDVESEPPPEAPRMPEVRPVRLLLVDDDPELCRMFGSLFRRYGFEVLVAPDGEAGFAAAVAQPFDIVVADLNMPRLDGWGLLRRIREDFRTRELVFALLSNQDNYREALEALDAGAQAYYSKTTTPLATLVRQIQALLEPRARFEADLLAGRVTQFPVQALGPQWILIQLSAAKLTGRVDAQDAWANYQLFVQSGEVVYASGQSGAQQLHGEGALIGFIASGAVEASWTPGQLAPKAALATPMGQLLARATQVLNANSERAASALLVAPGSIEVNQELYRVYQLNGPQRSLGVARMLCEEKLTPREIMERAGESPVELEETLRDLMRRGVVAFRPPAGT